MKNDFAIYKKNGDILMGATRNNLWRIHRGYHYPRCEKTAGNSMKSYGEFCKEYGPAVYKYEHFYGISKKNSKTDSQEYINFMEKMGLKYKIIHVDEDFCKIKYSPDFHKKYKK